MTQDESLLSGLRVVDCGTYIAAPAAAAMLADFGAEVIKIERPPFGDPYRYLSLSPGMPVSPLPYCWILDGRNKKSIALNLDHDSAREVLVKLVAAADVFLTNFQPSLIQRFRLAYDDLHPFNSRLIYAQVTGYGEQGEDAQQPSYDQTAYWARSSLMFLMHNADAEPCRSPTGFGDHPTSMTVFAAVMLALYRRQLTGLGMKVSTSLMANGVWSNAALIQAALLGAQFMPRTTRKTVSNPLVNHYVTRDQKRFITCCLDPKKDWPNFCRALDRPDLIEDSRFRTPELRVANSPALIAIIDVVIAGKDLAEWVELFKRHDIVCAPVLSPVEVTRDRQMQANDIFPEIAPGLRTVSNPLNLEGVRKTKPSMAPEVGQHTLEILSSLGYSEEAVAELLKRGAAMARKGKVEASSI